MSFLSLAVCVVTVFLAYSNGANDNFKGVSTLFGSGTTDYQRALGWATITTFAGSVSSYFLARGLVNSFSGKGLVPDVVVGDHLFLVSVMLGAAATVFVACAHVPPSLDRRQSAAAGV